MNAKIKKAAWKLWTKDEEGIVHGEKFVRRECMKKGNEELSRAPSEGVSHVT